jgi:hypothetical protein
MPAPTVEMGLGGSFLAKVLEETDVAYWPMRYRSGLVISAVGAGVSDGDLRRYVPFPLDMAGTINDYTVNTGTSMPGGGYALTLDGVDAYLVHDTSPFTWQPDTDPFTIEVVLTINATPSVGAEPAIMSTSSFGLTYKDDGKVYAYYNGTSFANYAVATGSQVHLVLTRAGTSTDSVNFYVNGVNRGSSTPARVSFAFTPAYFGKHWTDAEYLSATYDFAAVYPSELSAARVSAHYAALAWTDVTSDTLGAAPLTFERGIRNDQPSSRVASTGTLTFSMNNLASNSGGVTGYYSPGHASCRSGFGKGAPVRVKSGSDVIFTGRVRAISPSPGKTGGGTKVVATDYLDVAATSLMENVSILENVTGDQVFAYIVENTPAQPYGLSSSTGSETYTLALDNTRDEAVSALSEFHRLAMSELGYIYQTRTGALVYEARSTRISNEPTPTVTLADTMHGVDVAEVAASSLNRVQVTVHPRVIDAAATTVLYELVNPLQLAAGETKVIIGPFRAATATGITTRVGGLSMVDPVATTDYTMNTASDGAGTDLTSSMTVVADYGPNGVRLTLTNGATDAAYVTKMQCRGKGVYDFRTVVLRAQNDAAIASDGVNALNIDMVYQEDASIGQSMADALLSGYGDLDGTRVRQVSFLPDAAGMPAGLWTKDISDRVAVSETVTGATGEYYINGVKHAYQNGTLPRITWWLAPAEPVSFWVLGTSTLGDNTMLGV